MAPNYHRRRHPHRRRVSPSLLLAGAFILAFAWVGLSLQLAMVEPPPQHFPPTHHNSQGGPRRHLGAAATTRTVDDHKIQGITNATKPANASVPPPLKPRCALLFFGAPRLFRSVVLPSIRKHLIGPNPSCDVFVHTYNATLLSSDRSGETNQTLRPTDVLDLTAPSRVILEPPNLFHNTRNLSWFREHHHSSWGPCCGSTDNMIKQWHSIEGVWDLMEAHHPQNSPYYHRVGLFRSDVFYTHPIQVEDSIEEAVVPDWVFKGRKAAKGEHLINDRMFYGTYENAKVWAKGRFPYAPKYLRHYQDAQDGRRQGIHSESFLHSLLVQAHHLPLTLAPVCFWRTRATGMIMAMDCQVPGDPSGALRDPSDWDLLQAANATCCWECWRMDIQPSQYGPCTPETQVALRPEPSSRSSSDDDHHHHNYN